MADLQPITSRAGHADRPATGAEARGSDALRAPRHAVRFGDAAVIEALRRVDQPCYLVREGTSVGACHALGQDGGGDGLSVEAACSAYPPEQLGSASFRHTYGTRYAYHAGAMANGIASEQLVIALARAGFLASYGAAGLVLPRVEQAITRLKQALPQGPYVVNLIHSPAEPALEQGNVELFLKHGVRVVEASAFLGLTPHVVRYRVAGLRRGGDGRTIIGNRLIAKISRPEIATKFMEPAPERLIAQLLQQGSITQEQAALAATVPMADDITVEADSAGHTDNRPFITILPIMLQLRARLQAEHGYAEPLRLGVGGGIGTPEAVLAAFVLGADYVVTGSINQACVQAGTSEPVRRMLAAADVADFAMAPAADMFELGVKLQVLKRGTMFAMRAARLYELYKRYDSLEAIPAAERTKVEQQIFRAEFEQIWQQCVTFFNERDPEQVRRAAADPKRKMALVFRWYLGMSSRWANDGQAGREADYQIWAGPALGAFNHWTAGTYLADPAQRDACDVARHLMRGAAYLQRVQQIRLKGIALPTAATRYAPTEPCPT